MILPWAALVAVFEHAYINISSAVVLYTPFPAAIPLNIAAYICFLVLLIDDGIVTV